MSTMAAANEQGTVLNSNEDEGIVLNSNEDEMKNDSHIEGDASSKEVDETAEEEAREKLQRVREARAQALTLEIVGDLPYAEVKPPENVLFVCKLNPVTEGQNNNSSTHSNLSLTLTAIQTRTWTLSSAVSVR